MLQVDLAGQSVHGIGFVNSGRSAICRCSHGMIGPKELRMPAYAGAGNCDCARPVLQTVKPACALVQRRLMADATCDPHHRAGRVGLLLLPYLLTPLYRTGHPVSTLMIWRGSPGAPVARQWIDFAAISPALPRTGGGVGGRQVLQSSWHRLGCAAGRDRRRRGRRGRRAAARPSPSRWRKTCSSGRAAAWSARRWNSRWRCGSIWCCPSSGFWKSI